AQDIIKQIGPENLAGKVVVDTSNSIKQENNTLVYDFGNLSTAEQVQQWLPDSLVVKAFNTVGADAMYKPDFESKPTMFLAGNDDAAKRQAVAIIESFGWEPLDSGGLIAAREL